LGPERSLGRPWRRALGLLVIPSVLVASEAAAYIDPGTGALIVQAVVSSVVGVLFFARRTIQKLYWRISGKKRPAADDAAMPEKRE
jgi:uncharacterized membrane protein